MAHDVFISYSRRDSKVAMDICNALKRNKISYWIDTAEVGSGENFAEKIVPAIRDCKVTIFISSNESNISQYTVKEIVLAFKQNKHIIPFRIENISFCDELEFFLCDLSWVDAFKDYGQKVDELVSSIKRMLSIPGAFKSSKGSTTTVGVGGVKSSQSSCDGAKMDESGSKLLEAPRDVAEYAIPDGVTTIGEGAFRGCERLASVDIPTSVIRIERGAFEGCLSLKRVRVPNSVVEMGDGVFKGCRSLGSVMLSNSIVTLPISTFDGCSLLSSIVLPYTLSQIGDRAFAECRSLMTLMLPTMIREIGVESFLDCSSLGFMLFPPSLISIGARAFSGCRAMNVTQIPIGTKVDPTAFDGVRR